MKCRYCPALRTEGYEYPESYCALGVPDEEMIDFKDETSGCRRKSIDKLTADLKIQDAIENEAWLKNAESFVEFMKKEGKL